MEQADLLILESNHDQERLLAGPYPTSLKRRIGSVLGHLSNAQAAQAVCRAWSPKRRRGLWLAHLSRMNNTPSLALTCLRTHLQNAGFHPSQISLAALPPTLGEIWDSSDRWDQLSLF
jgi:phosphoribosyl 1,2-cyclic phosphodiesterase